MVPVGNRARPLTDRRYCGTCLEDWRDCPAIDQRYARHQRLDDGDETGRRKCWRNSAPIIRSPAARDLRSYRRVEEKVENRFTIQKKCRRNLGAKPPIFSPNSARAGSLPHYAARLQKWPVASSSSKGRDEVRLNRSTSTLITITLHLFCPSIRARQAPRATVSRRQLNDVATPFECQGLELDYPIVCWGDFEENVLHV
jgi:schlafen family protein